MLTYYAASGLGVRRDVGKDAAIAKLFTSEALIQTTHDAVQILGGYGFMTETGVERSLRDAVASTIYSGTSEVQRNIIAILRPLALLSFQAISHRIADMKVRLEASRLLTYYAASGLGVRRDVGKDAAIAKLFTSEALIQTTHDAVQILGGYGFMTETGVERSLRDAVASTIYSGTSEVQRNIIARWLRL